MATEAQMDELISAVNDITLSNDTITIDYAVDTYNLIAGINEQLQQQSYHLEDIANSLKKIASKYVD